MTLRGRGFTPTTTRAWSTPPPIPPSPTDDEDLSTKPAAQIAFRASYPTTYGLVPAVDRVYCNKAAEYRSLYYRLHAEVDGPLDRVRRTDDARTDADADGDDASDGAGDGSTNAGRLWKIVRTFDDPATWTQPGVRHLAADGPAGEVYRTEACDRFLADEELKAKVLESLPIGEIDVAVYDVVYLAGGWGAAFDLGFSEDLGRTITEANQHGSVIDGNLVTGQNQNAAPMVAREMLRLLSHD